MITILSQDRLKIIHCNAVYITHFGNPGRVIYGSTDGESEYALGRYKPERAKEIIKEIWYYCVNDEKYYRMPEV